MKNKLKVISAAFLLFIGFSCTSTQEVKEVSLKHISDTKTLQYAIEGKRIYDGYCANCHQADGTGLGRVIPPLANSDYMIADLGRTIRIIKYGLKGEIIVNGVSYNQPMPGNPNLSNLEIAQLATFLYSVWGENEQLIPTQDVEMYLRIE
jgi:cytochrome c551